MRRKRWTIGRIRRGGTTVGIGILGCIGLCIRLGLGHHTSNGLGLPDLQEKWRVWEVRFIQGTEGK